MQKAYTGLCLSCNQVKLINNTKCICVDCVYKKNHNGKTREEVKLEKVKKKLKFFEKYFPFLKKENSKINYMN